MSGLEDKPTEIKRKFRKSKLLTAVVMLFPLFAAIAIISVVIKLMFFSGTTLGPLQKAAFEGDLGRVKQEIQKGGPVDQVSPYKGWTALHAAAHAGSLEVAQFLLVKGADPQIRDERGYTPLHNCGNSAAKEHPTVESEKRRAQIAKLLIEKGVEVDERTPHEETALHRACSSNSPNVAKVLLEEGANPNLQNLQGMTPLHICCSWNRNTTKIVQLLIQYGADPSLKDEHGRTAKDLAREYNPSAMSAIPSGPKTRPGAKSGDLNGDQTE